MRSILWGCVFSIYEVKPFGVCNFLRLMSEPFPSIQRCSVPNKTWLFFPFLKGISHSFQQIGATFKHNRQLTQFSFWWVKHFLQTNGMHLEWKGLFKMVRTAGLCFGRSVTSLPFKEMMLPSHIGKKWALKGVLLHLFSKDISYSAAMCTSYSPYSETILLLLFKQVAAALSEVFFCKGKCICLRTYFHHEKGRKEYRT